MAVIPEEGITFLFFRKIVCHIYCFRYFDFVEA